MLTRQPHESVLHCRGHYGDCIRGQHQMGKLRCASGALAQAVTGKNKASYSVIVQGDKQFFGGRTANWSEAVKRRGISG